jgi:hypothetical protein
MFLYDLDPPYEDICEIELDDNDLTDDNLVEVEVASIVRHRICLSKKHLMLTGMNLSIGKMSEVIIGDVEEVHRGYSSDAFNVIEEDEPKFAKWRAEYHKAKGIKSKDVIKHDKEMAENERLARHYCELANFIILE